MDSERYRDVMRHQAGAVAVIAVGPVGHRTGLTATAVCSLSDAPPKLLICVNRNASAHDPIASTGCFSVNLLAEDQQEIAARFSGRTGAKGEQRFDGAPWATAVTGAPVLTTALASLDCRVDEQIAASTHTIYIGMVIAGRFRGDVAPLLYFRGDYWHLRNRSVLATQA